MKEVQNVSRHPGYQEYGGEDGRRFEGPGSRGL
jgi:hypothetical protein